MNALIAVKLVRATICDLVDAPPPVPPRGVPSVFVWRWRKANPKREYQRDVWQKARLGCRHPWANPPISHWRGNGDAERVPNMRWVVCTQRGRI